MKKKSFLITLLMLIGICCSMQAQTFQWGVRAGANINTKSSTPYCYDIKWRPGFNAGLVGIYNISDAFAIEADLQYSYVCSIDTTKYIFTNPYSKASLQNTTKSHFVDIPVLVKVRLFKGLCIEAGPQLGLQISNKQIYGGATNNDGGNVVNFSLVGGFSYAINDHWGVDVRYVHAFTNHIHSREDRNRTIQLAASYLF
ncbi:MAG: PorT family protein [Bacteroidaceae bacterium]|nr:PorT family protein [Bacteroidaceae bacterium]